MLPVACAVVPKNCCALVVPGGELAPCVSWVSVFLRALEKWEGKVFQIVSGAEFIRGQGFELEHTGRCFWSLKVGPTLSS